MINPVHLLVINLLSLSLQDGPLQVLLETEDAWPAFASGPVTELRNLEDLNQLGLIFDI